MPAPGTIGKAEEIALSVKNLPSLPAVIQKLLMVLDDMNCSAQDIERIVATDPALTARILKLANSPLYKGIDSVATISQAVTRLGFWKLRDVAISVGTTETLSEMADEKVQREYWHHALYTATCANALTKISGNPIPEESFVAGLLHDIGELVLAAITPEQYALLQKIDPNHRLENEEDLFGATHPRIGAMLLRQWLLPKPLCDAVRMHHNEQVYTSSRAPVISVVALADMLGKLHGIGSEPNWSPDTLFLVAKHAGIEIDQFAQVLAQVDEQITDTRKNLEIAGDVSFLKPDESSRNYNVAVVSLDPSMATWHQQLLSYFGHTAMSTQDFFAAPDDAHLVILDPAAACSRHLAEWMSALEQTRNRLVVVENEERPLPNELQAWDLPKIDVFLTQDEIKRWATAGIS